MGERLVMKLASFSLFTLLMILGLSSQAASLQGLVFISGNQYFFSDADTHTSYLLKPTNKEAQEALGKLKSLDTFSGRGIFGPGNTVYLESVDFVSLRRLLGVWRDPSVVVNFVDYSRVNFYIKGDRHTDEYSYAVAPAEGDNWRIFFSDQASVVLGSLTINRLKAQIELYDSNTGEVSKRFSLQKILQKP